MDFKRYRFAHLIFAIRWLQAPLYVGLAGVLGVYVYKFAIGLYDLIVSANKPTEIGIMLQALDLIDMVMIANLLIMVIIGGYDTFISHLDLSDHKDQPDWLDEVNAGSMKVKLAIALITISSIHLLGTFIDPSHSSNFAIMWQVIIHLTLVLSAVMIALVNRIM